MSADPGDVRLREPAEQDPQRPADPEESSLAEASVERVRAAVEKGANAVTDTLGRGLRGASRVFEAPAGTDVESLVEETKLPKLPGDDPIAELARRLDRESDLWRNLAMREIARVAWAGRVAQLVAIFAVVAEVALGVVAGLGVMLGAEHAGGRALLVLAAAAGLTVGTLVAAGISGSVRRSLTETAREALERADTAERRLRRLAIVLAWRKGDPEKYADALTRYERDASS